jgi:hypothetical protein
VLVRINNCCFHWYHPFWYLWDIAWNFNRIQCVWGQDSRCPPDIHWKQQVSWRCVCKLIRCVHLSLAYFHGTFLPAALFLARISALRLNFAVTEGLHFYWAGDVEHTHLVKGLDYALLHKIRSEIDKRPEDDELVENAKHRYVEGLKVLSLFQGFCIFTCFQKHTWWWGNHVLWVPASRGKRTRQWHSAQLQPR